MDKKLKAAAIICAALLSVFQLSAQHQFDSSLNSALRFRSIGPFRGGRSVTATGVKGEPLRYYMGVAGGGVWRTDNGGQTWNNISDGYFNTGSVGAVAVSESDPNVVYVGMGEHAVRGVSASYGDGVYKSTDAGKTWKHIGLKQSQHISWIRIHPANPDIVFVAAQGQLYGANNERGVFKSTDGGTTWKKVLYVDEHTGCADLDIDASNPRMLMAAMWDYQRYPWEIRSGGKGSGLYRSTDMGETWTKITAGIPADLGKMGVSISRADPSRVYALIESDWNKEAGGLYTSNDGGLTFTQTSKDHRLTQRAWYYIEVFADPQEVNTLYVLNSPGLKSTDGGKTWTYISGTHGDYHQLWINPANNKNQIVANDGGAAITYDGGKVWSTQNNQPTAQFYRISVDDLYPYNIYAGQQDNTSVKAASSIYYGGALDERTWWYSAGGESAFLAFDPKNPVKVMGGSYQGTIELLDVNAIEGRNVMVAPIQYQALQPKNMKYRFNWNAPIIYSRYDSNTFYHAGNRLFRSNDDGKSWKVVSPDLTRNDTTRQGTSGTPFTNEGAGGENYGTISYVLESPLEKGTILTGSDDGLLHITRNNAESWENITPKNLPECLINCIEVSPHSKSTIYIAATTYKFNDQQPMLYKSDDYGKNWQRINGGIPNGSFTRCIREDDVRKGLLFAGTENGLFVSTDGGGSWKQRQFGLPITPITDLKVHRGNLIAATMGRSFWILDDLSLLRQFETRKDEKQPVLYRPADVYRTNGRSFFDNGFDATDAKGLSNPLYGVNAPGGAVIYYQLPATLPDTATIYLDVIDNIGVLVRSFSSKPDPDFKSFPGGPDEEPVLPSGKGLQRFVWDLRYPTLRGVPDVFIEGSYRGRRVAPGAYLLRLRADGKEATAPVRVLPSPGINATKNDYANQQAFQKKVEDEINTIHGVVINMRKADEQLKSFATLHQANNAYKGLVDSAKNLQTAIHAWEDKLVQTRAQSNDDIINFINMLTADYIFLKGEADTNTPFVSAGMEEQFTALNKMWLGYKSEHDALRKRIENFNAKADQQNVPRIVLKP